MDQHDWDDRYRGRELLWTVEPNRFVVSVVGALDPGSALVLAAGEGRNAVWLAEQGWQVTAVDWSGVAVDKGTWLAAERDVSIEWQHIDLLEWEPGPDVYDLVTIAYLQIPAPGRESVWRKAAASVGPGGHLLMIGHDSRNLEEGYGGPSHPSVLYTASQASLVVGESLDIERAETVVRPVDVEGGVRYAIDNLVMARRG